MIGDGRAHRRGRVAVVADGADEPTRRLAGEVCPPAVGIRPMGAEGARRRPDDPRVQLGERFVSEPPTLQDAGREIADHDIRPRGQPAEYSSTRGCAQIEGEAALAAVAGGEEGAAPIVEVQVNIAHLVAEDGHLYLDDIGAHVRQQGGRLGTLHHHAGIENPYVAQCSRHGSVFRRPVPVLASRLKIAPGLFRPPGRHFRLRRVAMKCCPRSPAGPFSGSRANSRRVPHASRPNAFPSRHCAASPTARRGRLCRRVAFR